MSPRYVATVASPWSAPAVLAYMADFTHAAEWDPSVVSAVVVNAAGSAPEPVGPGSAFDLTVRIGRRTSALRYVITAMSEHSVQLSSTTAFLRSIDTVTVVANPSGGTTMTYDARLSFRGVAKLANPLLTRTLRTLGDNAAAMLKQKLSADAPR